MEHPEDRPEDYSGFETRLTVVPWQSGASLQGDF
jgi:hypothetical protein